MMFFLSIFVGRGSRGRRKKENQLRVVETLSKSVHNPRVYHIGLHVYFGSRIAQGRIISSIEMPPCWNPPLNWCL